MNTEPGDPVLERVQRVAAQTFMCAPDEIGPATVASDVAGWDSLSYTIFIMNVETEFACELDPLEITNFTCIGDLIVALREKMV